MRTGPKLKGRQVAAPGGGRSANHPDVLGVKMRGKANNPGGSRSKNHPSVAPIPKNPIGKALPNSFYANSRTDVHPKFNTKKKHD